MHLRNDNRVLIATTESKNSIIGKGRFHRLTLQNMLTKNNESQVKMAKLYLVYCTVFCMFVTSSQDNMVI